MIQTQIGMPLERLLVAVSPELENKSLGSVQVTVFPSTLLGYLPSAGSFLLDACRSLQTSIWLAMLLFLLYRAELENRQRRDELAGTPELADTRG